MIRQISGLVGFAVAGVLFSALVYHDAQPMWRTTIFLPAIMGTLGWLQAQENT